MPSRNFSGPRCTRLIASFLIRLPKSCIRLVSYQKLGWVTIKTIPKSASDCKCFEQFEIFCHLNLFWSSIVQKIYLQVLSCCTCVLKSDNLQYNMLGYWVNEMIVSLTKYYFLSQFLAKFFAKIFSIYFFIFYNFSKIKSFECPKSKPATHCFIFNLSK